MTPPYHSYVFTQEKGALSYKDLFTNITAALFFNNSKPGKNSNVHEQINE